MKELGFNNLDDVDSTQKRRYAFCGMAWLERPMKVVASCDKLWGGACSH